MKSARTKSRGEPCDGLFERLEEREEGEGNDGGVGVGVPDGDFRGIERWYGAGSGEEAEGKDDEGGEELHFLDGAVDEGGVEE
jgi:hypothetical protein